MKCHLMQRPKHRASTEDKKKAQKIVNEYMALSLAVGPEKALEIMKARNEEASKVLENEKECIQRQVNGNCDNKRDCANCDFAFRR